VDLGVLPKAGQILGTLPGRRPHLCLVGRQIVRTADVQAATANSVTPTSTIDSPTLKPRPRGVIATD
jgi:hypothetical protein